MGGPAPAAKVIQRVARPVAPAPPARPQPQAELATAAVAEDDVEQAASTPPAPVEQGLGNVGVIAMAILAGVLAWLVSSLIKI
jgi:hypothetical protein